MRIVFLSFNYSSDVRSPADWIERLKFYIGWSEYLTKEYTVIRVDQINYQGIFTHNGIQYHCFNPGRKNNYLPWKLFRAVKNLKPDIVVVSSFMFPLQVIQLRFCLARRVKIILQHHAEKPFSGIKKYVQKLASRQVDCYLFVSRETGAAWVSSNNLASEDKLRALPEVSSDFYPVAQKSAREVTGVSGLPAFIWVGRLNQNKDPVLAVRAFLRFSEWQPHARLYMIYHTDELVEEIVKLLPKKPLLSPILLVGKIPHKDLVHWFNSADYYLSASHYEGSGTALCEAMSCGCIPVVTNIPSFKTIIANCGLLFEPGNEESLVSVLKQTSHLPVDDKKHDVLKRFESELSFITIAEKFKQILDSI